MFSDDEGCLVMRSFARICKIISLLALGFSEPLRASADDRVHPILGFIATKVEGHVVTRTANGAQWLPVKKNSFIADYQILQITSDGHIELARAEWNPVTRAKTRLSGDLTGVSITAPAIIRTGPELLRKIQLSRYFIEDLPAASKEALKEPPKLMLEDAWRRVSAIIMKTVPIAGNLLKMPGNETQMTGGAGLIKLLVPTDGSYYSREEFPSELNVVWVPRAAVETKKQSYKVYLWAQGAERGEPAAMTSSESYRLKVPRPGDFLVQVETNDGSAQSRPHHIYLTAPSQMKNLGEPGDLSNSFAAKLHGPKMGQIIVSPSKSIPVRFSWTLFTPSDQDLILIIKKGEQEIVKRPMGDRLSYNYVLEPGDYSWQLVWKLPGAKFDHGVYREASNINAFRIESENVASLTQTIDSKLKANQNAMLFVDHW